MEIQRIEFDNELRCYKSSIKMNDINTPKLKVIDSEINYVIVEILDNNFYNLMMELDMKLIKFIHENSLKIFGSDVAINVLHDMYKKSIQLPIKIGSNPYLKIKTSEYDKLNIDNIIEININIDFIYFFKNKCYTEFVANEIILNNQYMFNDDDETNNDINDTEWI